MVSVAGPGALTSFGVGLRARANVDPSITAAAVLRLHSGRVAEWQTRTVQVRVSERMWGFNSPLAHTPSSSRARWSHAARPQGL
jgi:hypothetical protein